MQTLLKSRLKHNKALNLAAVQNPILILGQRVERRLWSRRGTDLTAHGHAKKDKRPPLPAALSFTQLKNGAIDESVLEGLRTERKGNLRQLLLRAHRSLNRRIATKLNEFGYTNLRPGHLALFSNIDFEGTSVGELSERAGMTIQGMGQIVTELEAMGYVTRTVDETDRRVRIVRFTAMGWTMMLDSIKGLKEIESELEKTVNSARLDDLRVALKLIADAL
jgi:DNA-binding MarR family transcriptional regulator